MTEMRITCIVMSAGGTRCEHIEQVGGYGWKWTVEAVIGFIDSGNWTFYVEDDGGNRANVKVMPGAGLLGRRYLKTEQDGVTSDNLLSLPRCP